MALDVGEDVQVVLGEIELPLLEDLFGSLLLLRDPLGLLVHLVQYQINHILLAPTQVLHPLQVLQLIMI